MNSKEAFRRQQDQLAGMDGPNVDARWGASWKQGAVQFLMATDKYGRIVYTSWNEEELLGTNIEDFKGDVEQLQRFRG